jgi:hypothetical protein
VLLRCGRCRRVLCQALPAVSQGVQTVAIKDVRPYALLELDGGPDPRRRAHLTCHRRCMVDGRRTRYTRRLDKSALVARVHAWTGGGGELALGVDA